MLDNIEEIDAQPYVDFAYVYDELMDNVPYEDWASKIHELIDKYGISKPVNSGEKDCIKESMQVDSGELLTDDYNLALESERNLVLDLGCGTGTLTEMLYDYGYDMIGIDLSEDMLEVAREKSIESGKNILYLHQDMREIDLYSTIGTVISVCDSINYLTDKADIVKVFKLVENYLYPGGLFIFDFNTLHKYKDVIGDRTITEKREDISFIWDNFFNEDTNINEYDLTVFVLEEEPDIYRRFDETHYQRGYTLEEMKECVASSGLEIVTCFDSDTGDMAADISERICFVCRKNRE